LARKALVGVGTDRATAVAGGAVGRVGLAGEQAGAVSRVAEDAQQRAEAVAEEEIGGLRAARDLQFTEEVTGQTVVVGAAL